MTPSLPSGRVTFLFTDIEGSTTHHHRLGDRYAAELDRHNRVVGGAIERNGGVVVKTEGDSFFAAFASATSAVAACVDAQRDLAHTAWPGGEPLRVRMGVHTGRAEVVDGDYVALAVNQAARVSAAAHGDQIVVTEATAAIAPHEGWRYERLGEFRLRGFDQPAVLYQVAATGLRGRFPPLRAPGIVNHNLPSPGARLIGRDDDVDAVGGALASERLVTLVGPGGIGKTSLAIAVAERAAPRHPGGAWWVDLAAVKDADLVPEAVAASLGVLDGGGAVVERVEHRLVVAPTLLVLDTCEHVAGAVTALLDRILDRCPDAVVLATSRLALGQRRERVVEVVALGPAAAIAILAARAPDREPGALAAIARRLDGVPLALELVGAQLAELSAEDVLAGLDATGLSAGLDASLSWSYDLLDEVSAACFRRLAAFAGACTLEAAAHVCADEGASPVRVAEIILDLADRSLLHIDRGDRRRVRLLDTVRAFAADHLARDDTAAVTRHFAWYRSVAEEAAPALLALGPERRRCGERLSPEVEDLRRALTRAEGDTALLIGRVAGAVRWQEARFAEAAQCYAAALARSPDASAVRARATQELSDVLFLTGDIDEAERWATEALELATAVDEPVAQAHALLGLARVGTVRSDVAGARALLDAAAEPARLGGTDLAAQRLVGLALCAERDGRFRDALDLNTQAVALARAIEDPGLLATALTNLASSNINLGDFPEAERILRDAVAVLGELPVSATKVHAVANLAYLAFRRGDLDEARRLGAETLEFAGSAGHVFSLALGFNNLAEVELAAGNLDASEAAYRDGLTLGRKLGHVERVCYCIEGLAAVAASRGDHARAVGLLSLAERRRARERAAAPDTYRAVYEQLLVDARAALGPGPFAEAWQRGATLDEEEL